jgi:integrase/recombinase XerD
VLISEAFSLYSRDVIAFRNQSLSTEEAHDITCRNLILFLGDRDITSLTFEDIRRWKQWLDKGRSISTVRGYMIKLRVVLHFLIKRGYSVLDEELIPLPKKQVVLPSFISPEDVQRLIDTANSLRTKCYISLLYASGIRLSEMCSLNRGDSHDGSFSVVGKNGKARLCFYDDRTAQLMKMYYATRTDNNPAIFINDAGERITPSCVQEAFRIIRHRVGLDNVHPHTMRHSFATQLLRSNCNIRYVQELLGHSSLQTTQMYTHVVNEDLREQYLLHHQV